MSKNVEERIQVCWHGAIGCLVTGCPEDDETSCCDPYHEREHWVEPVELLGVERTCQ